MDYDVPPPLTPFLKESKNEYNTDSVKEIAILIVYKNILYLIYFIYFLF